LGIAKLYRGRPGNADGSRKHNFAVQRTRRRE
jgi:hypothetical protein